MVRIGSAQPIGPLLLTARLHNRSSVGAPLLMKSPAHCLSCVVVAFLVVTTISVVRSADTESANSPTEQYAALIKEFEQQQGSQAQERFHPRLLALADKYPDDPIAVDALAWVANNPGGGRATEASIRRPFDMLLRDHLTSEKLPLAFDYANDDFLRTVLEKSPHRVVRGLAIFILAEHHIWQMREVRRIRSEDPYWQIRRLWTRSSLHSFLDMNLDETAEETEKLLQEVVQDYAEVPIADRRNGKTLGELAKNHLHGIRDLGIGMVMPELKSTSLDGNPVQLADLKGKVLVLDVWATWCGPCCEMIPHEREMVKRLADKPFALGEHQCRRNSADRYRVYSERAHALDALVQRPLRFHYRRFECLLLSDDLRPRCQGRHSIQRHPRQAAG